MYTCAWHSESKKMVWLIRWIFKNKQIEKQQSPPCNSMFCVSPHQPRPSLKTNVLVVMFVGETSVQIMRLIPMFLYRPLSNRCECNDGYQLASDERGCDDINECNNNPAPCEYTCTNTAGSYECGCAEGGTPQVVYGRKKKTFFFQI